jgi:hypothetical protein
MKQCQAVLKELLTLMGLVFTPLRTPTSVPLGVGLVQAPQRALHVTRLVKRATLVPVLLAKTLQLQLKHKSVLAIRASMTTMLQLTSTVSLALQAVLNVTLLISAWFVVLSSILSRLISL